MVACLENSDENAEFHQIVDFISTCSINYALTLKDLPKPFNDTYVTPCHTKKVFSNMARKSVNFSGNITLLFASMLVQNQASEGEGGSPRRQDTMRGTPAQTRSERVLAQRNKPPLSEGHTSGSREGRMEHTFELMDNVPSTPYDSPLL
ncbi:hypothetical protein Tco_1164215 [Tanacetum coccineum]